MRIWPLIIDSHPDYLGHARQHTLLSLPLGTRTVFARVREGISKITPNAPTILAPVEAADDYAARLGVGREGARIVRTTPELADILAGYEISDVLLVIDPRCFPVSTGELRLLTKQFSTEQQVVHHLVAFERGVAGVKEQVNLDGDGQVRGIHRFYEPATWPFLAGVAASLVPASSNPIRDGDFPRSLMMLRERLMARGVLTRDLPIADGAWNIGRDQGLLAANEYLLSRHSKASKFIVIGKGQRVDPSVRVLGPVVVHSDAVVERNAVLVGPALIGSGARIGAGALVAHSIIGDGCAVPEKASVRDLAWFADRGTRAEMPPVRAQSFDDRLARVTAEVKRRDVRASRDYAIRLQLKAKRGLDMAAAAVGLLLLSPIFAAAAALIKLDSPGPVFYGSEREGVDGRIFRCWKFRTMRADAHAMQHQLQKEGIDGPHFKLQDDPRVTRLGRWLRATNIDELPQLYNVLRGRMSLVGPRPSPFRENQVCVPWREARLSVRPGMTGLWQICRQDRQSGDFHQWIEYDLLYVRHISFLLDLKILVATIVTAGGQWPLPAAWFIKTRATQPEELEAVDGQQPRPVATQDADPLSLRDDGARPERPWTTAGRAPAIERRASRPAAARLNQRPAS